MFQRLLTYERSNRYESGDVRPTELFVAWPAAEYSPGQVLSTAADKRRRADRSGGDLGPDHGVSRSGGLILRDVRRQTAAFDETTAIP